jgi:hypothetical protein
MPVDPNAVLDTITSSLSAIPPAIIAAVLLGGPTALWLIIRFTRPEAYGLREDSLVASEEPRWVCTACRSINEERHVHCYRCRLARAADSAPVLIPTEASAPISIAVGPGRPVGQPASSWLGIEPSGTRAMQGPIVGYESFEDTTAFGKVTKTIAPTPAEPTPAEPTPAEPTVTGSTKRPGRPGRRS